MSKQSKEYNKYDIYIFLLIASLVAGNLFGAFQLPRVLAILFFPSFLANFSYAKNLIQGIRNGILLFILYSFISVLWTPAGVTEGLIESLYNVVHAVLFLEIIVFSKKANRPLSAIVFGFLVAFLISALIAIWELRTDHHLSTSKTAEAIAMNTGFEVYRRYFAAATFYNFNAYTTFLCFIFPFLLYGNFNTDFKRLWRMTSMVAVVLSIALILYNGSRGGFIAIVLMAIVYALYSLFSRKRFSIYGILLVIALAIVLFSYGTDILFNLMMRDVNESLFEDESRFRIWANAWEAVKDYFFLGCGSGGVGAALEKYAHGGVIATHNIFLEILVEYGIFFLMSFLLFVFTIFKSIKHINEKSRAVCLYQVLCALPIIGIINSGYLTSPIIWAVMASIFVFANYERIKYSDGVLRQVA